MKEICQGIQDRLETARDFAGAFCAAKAYWFHVFAKGRVTSTRHGADFFKVVVKAIESGEYTYKGEEFDKNFALTLAEHGVKIKKMKDDVDE